MQKVQSTVHKGLAQWFAAMLVIAVILNGAHAKDVAGITLPFLADTKKTVSEESSHKLAFELHNHVDKQGKTLKAGTDNPQLDSRSFRLLKNHQKKTSKLNQSSWWAQIFERYSLFG